MIAKSLYASRDQPEKESKRERKKARKKERKKQGNQAFVETGPGPSLYFQRDFYTLTCTQKEMKDAKSYRVSPNITSVLSLSKPGFFFANLSHKQYCVHYLLALEACGHFMTNPLLIKVAQPKNLLSLKVFFLYISNLCYPQKMLNRVTFLKEQMCSELQQKKELISSKV